MASSQYDFFVNKADLEFILKQIKIAEASTNLAGPDGVVGTADDGSISNLAELVSDSSGALTPYGLRTVDGTWNSLLPGLEHMGAADNIMPRLVEQNLQNGDFGTSYASNGDVVDSHPRVVSNLIVDQSTANPAALIAAQERAAALGLDYVPTDGDSLYIPNLSPDIGLSPAFNGWMTLFGQFFDHGLDLITKGGNGTVFVPLKPDDPLYVEGSPTNFMVLTRATQVAGPGADGVLGTADDTSHESVNTTTPFVDQNQTYTSHPSHQVFLREYVLDANGKPQATGNLLDGANGGLPTWADVKRQAEDILGIRLEDTDIFNVPLLATDRYGEFIRGANGFAQMVTTTGLVEGDPSAYGERGIVPPANTIRTGHAFLDDIAHNSAPNMGIHPDADDVLGGPQTAGTYDNETLDRHFITGDGRGNENIGLTAVHQVFHSEHNRLVEQYKDTIVSSGDLAFLNEWLLAPVAALPATPEAIAALQWDGERLFQAGRFSNEMQYQHLVFEEFARAVQPTINPFVFSHSPDLDPAIFAEFANVVYRFGHSMLTESIDRINMDMSSNDIGLIEAFLNPVAFDAGYASTDAAVGAIVRGMSRQTGNEIDEFVVDALRNNLLGLPLDLATINMARARDTGMPSFNQARAAFYEMTGDSQLTPYASWAEFAIHMKTPASIINFIAAYGMHASITSATTLADKRAAATLLVMGDMDLDGDGIAEVAPADRVAFLNSTGAWTAETSGLNKVDFWIGGLAEAKNEFGGMLGSTFNFVFELQMQNLQNGDRFYYLSRTQGMNMLNELEANSFSKMLMRNSDLGDANSSHIAANIFGTANYILEVDQSRQIGADPEGDNPVLNAINPLVIRVAPGADVDGDGHADGGYLKYTGADHVVLGGTQGNDTLIGGIGIDTLWGDAGNDRLDGGDEADVVHGGDGDDIITDRGTPAGDSDFLHGDAGNDVISAGMGLDLIFGGSGNDFIILGDDDQEAFAGRDDDFVLGGPGNDFLLGNEGHDWMEGGEGFDTLAGDNSELFFNSPIVGNDVLNGQGNDTDYDGESGDDIMVQGQGIQRNNGMSGFDWAIHKGDPVGANSDLGIPIFVNQQDFILRDRFDLVEGLSGWIHDDVLIGTNLPNGAQGADAGGSAVGANALDSALHQRQVSLIDGLQELLGGAANADPDFVWIDPTRGDDIIIGGGGDDLITGKAGNDLLDGDAWLNVRIAVAAGPNNEAFSIDSLSEIRSRMLTGEINPGQLSIVREILQDDSGLDTAIYLGPRADYAIGELDPVTGIRTITDLTPNAGGAALAADEGTDQLRNFERIRFSDMTLDFHTLEPIAPVIDDITPTEGLVLSVSTADLTDANTALPFSYQWQFSSNNGNTWTNIAGATSASLVPAQAQVTQLLRVKVDYVDKTGLAVSTLSAATRTVGDLYTGSPGNDSFLGTAGDDIAFGLGGNDTFNGRGGADHFIGGLGNDTYHVDSADDVATENAGEGTDLVSSTVTYALGAGSHLDNLTLASTAAINGTGNELNNVIRGNAAANTLNGESGNDNLIGNGGNDVLNGGEGNDTLNGGIGGDTMNGGAGDDTYIVDSAGDSVNEQAGEGIDLVSSSITYSLGAGSNVENLTLSGTAAINGTGNELANILRGNASANTLNGEGGADTLMGNAGNDVLNGGDGDDTLNGGTENDTLNGGTGNDMLNGAAGRDTLTGGIGADRFIFVSTADSGPGASVRDIITDFLSGTDRIQLTSIDANTLLAGNQAFSPVGMGTLSGVAGQLRYRHEGGNTLLEGDVDGDALADIQIELVGVHTFVAADLMR